MSKTPVSQTYGHSTALSWSRYGWELIIDLGFKSVMFRKYQPQLPPSDDCTLCLVPDRDLLLRLSTPPPVPAVYNKLDAVGANPSQSMAHLSVTCVHHFFIPHCPSQVVDQAMQVTARS